MRKNKITTGLALLGVLGMSAVSPNVYASETSTFTSTEVMQDQPPTNFEGRGYGRFERGPGPGSMSAEEITEMSIILDNNDFDAFLEKMKENAPKDAFKITDEILVGLQTKFDHMVELYNEGQVLGTPLADVGSTSDRPEPPVGNFDHRGRDLGEIMPMSVEKQTELSTILASDDFDAFVVLMKTNASADAPAMSDDTLTKLQNRFDRMVERYKNGEMPWQQPTAPVELAE